MKIDELQNVLKLALEQTASPLHEVSLTRENWNKFFPYGQIETPLETVKLGKHQFEKLKQIDRNNLLEALYQTLAFPSLILGKETYDEKAEEFKPLHVYGKSFVHQSFDHKRIVESIVVFKDGENISISTHNKDIARFLRQIKTADQIIFANEKVSRVASLYIQEGGSRVQLKGIHTQALNLKYDAKKNLSSKFHSRTYDMER